MFTKDLTPAQLDTLRRKVCNKITYLNYTFEKIPFWEEELKLANEIEKNITSLDSIILRVNKINENVFFNKNVIKKKDILLIRVLILLYYCHYGEEEFCRVILKELLREMDYFAQKAIIEDIKTRITDIFEYEKQLQTLQSQIPVDNNTLQTDLEYDIRKGFHNNVILEYVLTLLEKNGLQLTDTNGSKTESENYGNNTEAARLLNALTNIPFKTCSNYITARGLPTARRKEVEALNQMSKNLIIDIEIQTPPKK